MIERVAFRRLEHRRALFSPCEQFRYLLEIVWPSPTALRAAEMLPFIGLNPSTATHAENDQTIRRCVTFARALGFRGLRMLNLAAFRATAPREMLRAPDPIGPENSLDFLRAMTEDAPFAVACWGSAGAHSKLEDRARAVRAEIGGRLRAFGLTANGQPLHPLYLPHSAALTRLSALEVAAARRQREERDAAAPGAREAEL